MNDQLTNNQNNIGDSTTAGWDSLANMASMPTPEPIIENEKMPNPDDLRMQRGRHMIEVSRRKAELQREFQRKAREQWLENMTADEREKLGGDMRNAVSETAEDWDGDGVKEGIPEASELPESTIDFDKMSNAELIDYMFNDGEPRGSVEMQETTTPELITPPPIESEPIS